MSKEFNEDSRVKFPATLQFMRLGYEHQPLKDYGADPSTKICVARFRSALQNINPSEKVTDEAVAELLEDLKKLLSNEDGGKKFYRRLVGPSAGLKLVDFDNPEQNDFAVVNELRLDAKTSFGHKNAFRPDITVLVNGLPLAFLEVKKPNNPNGIQAEFRRMLDERLQDDTSKKFFNLFQIVAFSNNMSYDENGDAVAADEIRAGSFYTTPNGLNTTFSFFREEEPQELNPNLVEVGRDRIAKLLEDNCYDPSIADSPEFHSACAPTTPCNSFVVSLFSKERFLFLVKYGITYLNTSPPQKHIMRYPQFFAARKLLKKLETGQTPQEKSGIVWHTQGSGKTALAASLVRILTDFYAKRQIVTRFYYVVDRLDLLAQASAEMTKRELHVVSCDSRDKFQTELEKTISDHDIHDALGEITVVNIHKFVDDPPTPSNEYNVNVQRIFFVDEAHRSYKKTGVFFRNLKTVDENAVYIALTGTPLLSATERSSLKFGGYIHTYFYDKSIADGYTLRIKREEIETVARLEIKESLEIEKQAKSKQIVYESDAYVDALSRYVDKDFRHFRSARQDDSLGAMVVCSSNTQAKKVKRWFDERSKFSVGLVISDLAISDAENKATQLRFRDAQDPKKPDILVVHQMLTTGYDVPRLKKLYLIRNAREHSLLQTISRVNRPYRNPKGRAYPFGYIVDFADIEEELNKTLEDYAAELKQEFDFNDPEERQGAETLGAVLVDADVILNDYGRLCAKLESYGDYSNKEEFVESLQALDEENLRDALKTLDEILECRTELLLSYRRNDAAKIDEKRFKALRTETANRLRFIKFKSSPSATLREYLEDEELVEISYEFVKLRTDEINLAIEPPTVEFVADKLKELQREIRHPLNFDPTGMEKLDAALKKLMENARVMTHDALEGEFDAILQRLHDAQEESSRLMERFGDADAFVAAYYDARKNYPHVAPDDLDKLFDIVYDAVCKTPTAGIVNRQNFVAMIKEKTSKPLRVEGLTQRLKLREWRDVFLGELHRQISEFGLPD